MKKKLRFLSLIVFAAVMLVPLLANAQLVLRPPFALEGRYPGSAQHLGFTKGNLLLLGANITPSTGCTITTATATNGVVYNLTHYPTDILPNNVIVWPMPLFDPELHLGVWEIYAEDSCGNSDTAWTHNFDKGGVMPYVKDIQASGDPLTPTITWKAPKADHIPDFCATQYRLRLLKASNDQFHMSGRLDDPEYTIPPGVLTAADIADTWVRIEHRCRDFSDDWGLEARSETFRHLEDLLMEANGF